MAIVAAFSAALLSVCYIAAGRLLIIGDYRKWYPFCGGFEKMKRQTSNKKEEAVIAPLLLFHILSLRINLPFT